MILLDGILLKKLNPVEESSLLNVITQIVFI